MITIFTVPHLPVENNFRGVVTGLNDQSLTSEATKLAPHVNFGDRSFLDIIFRSPMKRAKETVELCFQDSNIPVEEDGRLNPIDFGDFHVCQKNEVRRVRHKYIDSPFPNGESYRQMLHRTESFIKDAVRTCDGLTLLVIAHESTDALLRFIADGRGTLEEAIVGVDGAWLEFLKQNPSQIDMVNKPPEGPFFFE